jgi:hypothetical protein
MYAAADNLIHMSKAPWVPRIYLYSSFHKVSMDNARQSLDKIQHVFILIGVLSQRIQASTFH